MLTEPMKLQSDRRFIKNPNLPTGEVATAAISAQATQAIRKLESFGIEIIPIPKNPLLPKPVDSHTDLQLLHLKNNRILVADDHLFKGDFNKKFNIEITKEKLGGKYPKDVLLNCKMIGNYIVLNKRTAAREVLEFAVCEGINIIDVNQGYSGCSVCVINESALITDDESIYRAAQDFLNDVLFISKGSIQLNGYNYGFIGGCCGKISETELAVNGRIESHKDYKKIIDFAAKHNVDIVELTDERLTDIGGIIPLTERI